MNIYNPLYNAIQLIKSLNCMLMMCICKQFHNYSQIVMDKNNIDNNNIATATSSYSFVKHLTV